MKNFVKENLVLVVGLTLPLLLILIFFVATVIPKMLGTPPQYEMLFTTTRYDYQNPPDYDLDFSVKNQNLIVKAHKVEQQQRMGHHRKLLMAYDGRTETVREISLDMTQFAKITDGNEAPLQETSGWMIDASPVSPDGYKLDLPSYESGGLVGGIFGGDYRNNSYRLKKGNIGYRIPDNQGVYYYNQMQFVGWVIKK